jgi:hypothetical protein
VNEAAVLTDGGASKINFGPSGFNIFLSKLPSLTLKILSNFGVENLTGIFTGYVCLKMNGVDQFSFEID